MFASVIAAPKHECHSSAKFASIGDDDQLRSPSARASGERLGADDNGAEFVQLLDFGRGKGAIGLAVRTTISVLLSREFR